MKQIFVLFIVMLSITTCKIQATYPPFDPEDLQEAGEQLRHAYEERRECVQASCWYGLMLCFYCCFGNKQQGSNKQDFNAIPSCKLKTD